LYDIKNPKDDKSKNGTHLKHLLLIPIQQIYILFIIESDGSNDSGTSSFGSENKNNPKSYLSNIPYIETLKVK